MEIVLIAPRQVAVEELPYRPMRRAVFPPLGLLVVASLTPPEHRVTLIDEGIEQVPEDLEADLVGITASTATAPRAYQIADNLRSRGITVVMGGIHATALPEEAAQHADAVVIGEAEELWPKVLADFQRGELKKFYRHEKLPDLSAVPPPKWELLDHTRYVLPNTTQTTRGCPFDCDYCSVTTFFGRTYRTRRVEDVVAEVAKMPPGPLAFVDDNIMGNPRYARKLFAALKDLGRNWVSQASVTMIRHLDLIKRAAQAGCRALFVGLETLSKANLRDVSKHINLTVQYKDLVKILHDHGIAIVSSFMFGLDDDDPSVFDRTVEFIIDAKIDASLMSILTPLPGTRLFERLKRQGRIFDFNWLHYDGAHVVFKPAKMTVDQLQEGYYRAYKSLYSLCSILCRAIQPMGLRRLYWFMNFLWRRYVVNWITGLERAARRMV